MTRTLAGPATLDLVVKKSLFRARATPIAGEDDALAFLDTVHDPDATHNCWAWRAGARYRSFDDGEPGGTAGRPILQAIEMQDFDRVMVVVTRWFGGVKLGAGGLVRAYGGAAASCLREAESVEVVLMVAVGLHVPFALLAILQARLADWKAEQTRCDFDAKGAEVGLSIPEERQAEVLGELRDLTRGQSAIRLGDEV